MTHTCRNLYFNPATLPLPQPLDIKDFEQREDLQLAGSAERHEQPSIDGLRVSGTQVTPSVDTVAQREKDDVGHESAGVLGDGSEGEQRLSGASQLLTEDDRASSYANLFQERFPAQPDAGTSDQTDKLTSVDSGGSGLGPQSRPLKRDGQQVERKSPQEGHLDAAVPATPDEQHHTEVAESGQGSKHARMQSKGSSADLPSRFIQDAYEDGNSIMNISPLRDDSLAKNQVVSAKDQDMSDLQSATGMRSSILTGMGGETLKDPTISRRPPMRIDTGMAPPTNDHSQAIEKVPTQHADISTPSKSAPLSSTAQSPRERMTTRVSSGAIRHKSVSEILGETPKTSSPSDRLLNESARAEISNIHSPRSASSVLSPDVAAFRLKLHELRDKDRSKLSTVVFAKTQGSSGLRSSDGHSSQSHEGEPKAVEPRDYFLSFFATQAYQSPRAPALNALLRQAHKTLSTSDHYVELRDKQDYKILNQIKDMQQQYKWALRQPVRAPEPTRLATHWDVLLGQMKWMRTDFREERKFKHAGARHLAEACVAWVMASAEDRQAMQIKTRRTTTSGHEGSPAATPDLVHDETSDLTEDEIPVIDPTNLDPPATLFSLPPDVFVFGLNRSPVAEKLLLELPCYDPAREVQDAALRLKDADPDALWRTPIVPISKYAQGKLVPSEEGPPIKRTRLSYAESLTGPFTGYPQQEEVSSPADDKVALFNPENKHIRDRIHASHAFRPPSEYQMPSRDFFESRSPSQWTLAEDDELKRLVREYSYNWSLISSCLASVSAYSSGAERRTPWECFERWISLEGLPAEMSKVPYFRTYHQRLQQAARTYEARQMALFQQQGANLAQVPSRRRSNQPYTVEKRKSNKPLHLVDAMRKHAKKKEATLHKQQQQGKQALISGLWQHLNSHSYAWCHA